MKRKQLITLLVGAAVLATANGLSAAEKAQERDTSTSSTVEQKVDLREEIASPIAGEFTPANSATRSGSQQDFGGLSGNANGMDGSRTASGEPSSYPAPDGPSGQ